MWMNMSFFFSSNFLGVSATVGCVVRVDWTPWHCSLMCLNCVSSDSGKYFRTFFVSMSGHEL